MRRNVSVSSLTNGASTRQTALLTRKAENTPAKTVIAISKVSGRPARRMIQPPATAKKPESRRLATTIIMPSSKVSVSRSTAL